MFLNYYLKTKNTFVCKYELRSYYIINSLWQYYGVGIIIHSLYGNLDMKFKWGSE